MNIPPSRQNHYVPIWYQKGFMVKPNTALYRLDMEPSKFEIAEGKVVTARAVSRVAPKSCFWSEDLYTTRFGGTVNDEVERCSDWMYEEMFLKHFNECPLIHFAGEDCKQ